MGPKAMKAWALEKGFKPAKDNVYEYRLITPNGGAEIYFFGGGHVRFSAFVLHAKRSQSKVEMEGPTIDRMEAGCKAIGFEWPNR